jgi:hypothetical protein
LEQVVLQNADLLEEATMPDCLLQVCANVEALRAIIAAWSEGDHGRHAAPDLALYPTEELRTYTEGAFEGCKERQARYLDLQRSDPAIDRWNVVGKIGGRWLADIDGGVAWGNQDAAPTPPS